MATAADTTVQPAPVRPFAQALKDAQTRITTHMDARLGGDDALHAAMRYAVTGGDRKSVV